jgi:predicted DNA-binding protein YlxM (UPF0122 family)
VEKDLKIGLLLDFYGSLLHEKQRQVIEYYYNEDYSLSEIAELTGITRQGVRDSLKRGEATLREIEEKLRFEERFRAMELPLAHIEQAVQAIRRRGEQLQDEELLRQTRRLEEVVAVIRHNGTEVLGGSL